MNRIHNPSPYDVTVCANYNVCADHLPSCERDGRSLGVWLDADDLRVQPMSEMSSEHRVRVRNLQVSFAGRCTDECTTGGGGQLRKTGAMGNESTRTYVEQEVPACITSSAHSCDATTEPDSTARRKHTMSELDGLSTMECGQLRTRRKHSSF